jgi:hypothetical protein
VVAIAVDPPGEFDGFADVGAAKLTTCVVTEFGCNVLHDLLPAEEIDSQPTGAPLLEGETIVKIVLGGNGR